MSIRTPILRTVAAVGLLLALCRADEPAVNEAVTEAEGTAPTPAVDESIEGNVDENAPPAASIEPIKEIKGITPTHAAFKASKPTNPLVIKAAEEAERYFSKADLRKIRNTVDFAQQMLVLFAWRGSGGDRLGFDVAESSPEQITFKFRRGRTRDLRSHVRLFVLRSDVRWSLQARIRGVNLPERKSEEPVTHVPGK